MLRIETRDLEACQKNIAGGDRGHQTNQVRERLYLAFFASLVQSYRGWRVRSEPTLTFIVCFFIGTFQGGVIHVVSGLKELREQKDILGYRKDKGVDGKGTQGSWRNARKSPYLRNAVIVNSQNLMRGNQTGELIAGQTQHSENHGRSRPVSI
jgi:hypothetical protein